MEEIGRENEMQKYDYVNGLATCESCKRMNLEEYTLLSIVRVYEPELSYHANFKCDYCGTVYTVSLEREQYYDMLSDSSLG